MGCIRVTPRPSYYGGLALMKHVPPEEPPLEDKITISFHVGGVGGLLVTRKQAAIRDVVASVLGDRGRYHRAYNNTDDLGYYTWDNIRLHQTMLAIGPVEMSNLSAYEPLLDALADQGWTPDGETTLTFFPHSRKPGTVFNLLNIIESRQALVEKALGLSEPLTTFINDGLALGISLSAFSYPRIEASACLMAQACRMAETTGKARMKPCDMSNPRFQMRSWLLRLGFIGEAFERPRRTLTEGLYGDSAFFTEKQKKEAMNKRKMKRTEATQHEKEETDFHCGCA